MIQRRAERELEPPRALSRSREVDQERVDERGLAAAPEPSRRSAVPRLHLRHEQQAIVAGLGRAQLRHPLRRLEVLDLRVVEARGHQQVRVLDRP